MEVFRIMRFLSFKRWGLCIKTLGSCVFLINRPIEWETSKQYRCPTGSHHLCSAEGHSKTKYRSYAHTHTQMHPRTPTLLLLLLNFHHNHRACEWMKYISTEIAEVRNSLRLSFGRVYCKRGHVPCATWLLQNLLAPIHLHFRCIIWGKLQASCFETVSPHFPSILPTLIHDDAKLIANYYGF